MAKRIPPLGELTVNVLVTGASGGLGRHLLRCLAGREGLRIRALAHRSPVTSDRVEVAAGGLEDPASLDRAARGVETVVHLAAVTHTNRARDYFRVNVDGTENLLKACLANGVKRFIYVSSRAAHPNGGSYSESKLRAEELVKKSGLNWVILRPAEVYGPGSPDAINKLVQWIKSFNFVPVIGDGAYVLSPTFIDDALAAMTRAILDSGLENKTFVLAGPEEMTYTELVERLCRFLRVRRHKIFIPVFLANWLAEALVLFGKELLVRDQIPRLLCKKDSNIDLAVQFLDYRPRTLEDGLSLYLSR